MSFPRYLLLLSLPLYILDQVTKWWILNHYTLGQVESVIEGVFDIVRVHNTGVAFGRFNGSAYSNIIFSAVALAALAFILVLWKRGAFPNIPSRLAVFLLIPGILGNLTDRMVHGYVIDFLSVDLQFMEWPAFNVADSCICISAGLLLIGAFVPQKNPVAESPS